MSKVTRKFPSLQPEADGRCSSVVMVSRIHTTGGRLYRCTASGAIIAIRIVVSSVDGRRTILDRMDNDISGTGLIMADAGKITRVVGTSMGRLHEGRAGMATFKRSVATRS